jgi:hypothetical protein
MFTQASSAEPFMVQMIRQAASPRRLRIPARTPIRDRAANSERLRGSPYRGLTVARDNLHRDPARLEGCHHGLCIVVQPLPDREHVNATADTSGSQIKISFASWSARQKTA